MDIQGNLGDTSDLKSGGGTAGASGGYHNGYVGRVGRVDGVVLWGGLDIYTSRK